MTSVQSASAGSGKSPVWGVLFPVFEIHQFYINFMTVSTTDKEKGEFYETSQFTFGKTGVVRVLKAETKFIFASYAT